MSIERKRLHKWRNLSGRRLRDISQKKYCSRDVGGKDLKLLESQNRISSTLVDLVT